jgi:hypothetical protein
MIMGAKRQVADSQVLINDQVQICEGKTWDETERVRLEVGCGSGSRGYDSGM